MKGRIPYLKPLAIRDRVEEYRCRYPLLQEYPIRIEEFVECDLEMDIVPEDRLREDTGSDAIITNDFSSIFIDKAYYLADACLNRVRFSIAHELGHMVLHRDFLSNF